MRSRSTIAYRREIRRKSTRVKNALFLEVPSVKVLIRRIACGRRPKKRRELAGATGLEPAASGCSCRHCLRGSFSHCFEPTTDKDAGSHLEESPIRKLWQDPRKILAPFVQESEKVVHGELLNWAKIRCFRDFPSNFRPIKGRIRWRVWLVSDISNGSCQDLFCEFFVLSFLFSGTPSPSLRRVVFFVPLNSASTTTARS